MSPYKDDRLKDYVEVNERIEKFYERFPDGRLTTYEVRLTSEPDDKPRVQVWAKAYRTPDDKYPGDGWSWMELPGTTPYTKGSELENTETSAWGRALAAVGIEVKRSIASADEVRNKSGETERVPLDAEPYPATLVAGYRKVAGKVDVGKQAPIDLRLRQDPDKGAFIGFRLIEPNRKRLQVVAEGTLAEVLYEVIGHDPAKLYAQEVTAEGTVGPAQFTDKDGRVITFARMNLERLVTKDWTLPAGEPVDEEPEEALSVPALTEDALAGVEA